MVRSALDVSTGRQYEAWASRYRATSSAALEAAKAARWQQFVVHAVDERGDGIRDYFLQLGTVTDGRFSIVRAFDMEVHAYKEDPSYRCFHVNLDKLGLDKGAPLALRVIASSGTELVGYQGYNSSADLAERGAGPQQVGRRDRVRSTIGSKEVEFFFPYTTTLVELRMNREPMPLEGIELRVLVRRPGTVAAAHSRRCPYNPENGAS
jgi:hypothetical protein